MPMRSAIPGRYSLLCATALLGLCLGVPGSAAQLPGGPKLPNVAADLDGDRQPDFATAKPEGYAGNPRSYRVDVHLSAHDSTAFNVDSQTPGGLHIAALDIDGDHDLDLVITTEFGRQPVGVWINDGQGAFSQGDSAAYPGAWTRTRHSLESPASQTLPAATELGTPSGSALEPVFSVVAPATVVLPLFAAPARVPESLTHSTISLRGPPLS